MSVSVDAEVSDDGMSSGVGGLRSSIVEGVVSQWLLASEVGHVAFMLTCLLMVVSTRRDVLFVFAQSLINSVPPWSLGHTAVAFVLSSTNLRSTSLKFLQFQKLNLQKFIDIDLDLTRFP